VNWTVKLAATGIELPPGKVNAWRWSWSQVFKFWEGNGENGCEMVFCDRLLLGDSLMGDSPGADPADQSPEISA